MTKVCLSCREPQVRPLLDFGLVPLTNRFRPPTQEAASADSFRLKLGQCGRCGLVQLIDPPPAATIRAKVPWIAYQEPEGHLDDMVERLLKLPDIGKRSVTVGLSSKDDTTLRRLRSCGLGNVWRIDPAGDLGIDEPFSGLESVAERFEVDVVGRVVEAVGPADVVIARHVLEHVADIPRFVAAVKRLVRPGGYVVWEVPDCARSLELGDYSMLWEEHVTYFTHATLRLTLEAAGFETESLVAYPYARENSLVAIGKFGSVGRIATAPFELLEGEMARANAYADEFGPRQAKYEAYVSRDAEEHGNAALFGGGHASVMFLQLMRLAPYVDVCFDDDPNKHGLTLPGTAIPIRPSSELVTCASRLCLLAIGAEAQRRVIDKRADFRAKGGRFASIFPADAASLAGLIGT